MRRILRKIGSNQHDELGDVSTLADPSVVELIVKKHTVDQQWSWTIFLETDWSIHTGLVLSVSIHGVIVLATSELEQIVVDSEFPIIIMQIIHNLIQIQLTCIWTIDYNDVGLGR